jgi:phosphate transport system substrate-binding protein
MKSTRRSRYSMAVGGVLLAVALLTAAACGSSSNASSTSSPASGSGGSSGIVGAGSTFAQPLYSAWATGFQGASGVQLNYQGVGSTAGIAQIEAKTVEFGATDAPLTAADLQTNGLVQFPTAVGGTVPIINVSGVATGKLRLDGSTLANIYLGKITMWNDPAITALNPGLKLPATKISVVHRSDGSGTSWIFTSYLSAVSPTWKSQVGANTSPAWPTGTGGAKSAGVATLVQQVNGSIGYVEYAYAKQNNIATVVMKNAAGNFVAPTLSTFDAAAKKATWDPAQGFAPAIVNEPGASSWPITGATFALMQKSQTDAKKAQDALKFFDYGYKQGATTAQSLDYVPMPSKVYTTVEQQGSGITANGTPVWPAP